MCCLCLQGLKLLQCLAESNSVIREDGAAYSFETVSIPRTLLSEQCLPSMPVNVYYQTTWPLFSLKKQYSHQGHSCIYTDRIQLQFSVPSSCVDMIYLLTATGLTPGGSSTVHIYTQTIHRTTQSTTLVGRLSGI
jgi:hypothetical protein